VGETRLRQTAVEHHGHDSGAAATGDDSATTQRLASAAAAAALTIGDMATRLAAAQRQVRQMQVRRQRVYVGGWTVAVGLICMGRVGRCQSAEGVGASQRPNVASCIGSMRVRVAVNFGAP